MGPGEFGFTPISAADRIRTGCGGGAAADDRIRRCMMVETAMGPHLRPLLR